MNNLLLNINILYSKIAFQIGSFHVAWYAVIILSGALLGTLFGYLYFGKRLGITSDLVSEGLALGLLFGIFGARLYYVAFSNQTYSSFIDVINPSNGGLAIHGGLIAVGIYLPIWCKIRKIDIITLLEIALPLIMFAQCVGRWGNFVNQEAFGPVTTKETLQHLLIPNFIINNMYINGAYHHPTFLYESVANLIGLTIYQIVRKYNKKLYVGDAVPFYLIWYGIVRFLIEILRTDALIIGSSGIKIAQVVSITMIVAGITIFILRRVFKFRLMSCYDALYSDKGSLMIKKEEKKNKIIVFDCDGTVLDTFELIEHIVISTFDELFPDYHISKEEAHSFFGPFIDETFVKYATIDVPLDKCISTYAKYAELYTKDYIKAYPNMNEALKELKNMGYKLVIVSNKIEKEVIRGLDITNLSEYFDDIIGADKLTKVKPDPECINLIRDKYHVENMLLIGDSKIDIDTAINANITGILATWCKEKIEHIDGVRKIDDPLELINIGKEYIDKL